MMDHQEFKDIKGSTMLQGLSDEELDLLGGVAEKRVMEEGTTIFIENMPGESLFLIKQGTIRVSKMFAEGDEKTLVVLGPEDVFGEMAVIDGLPRSATARVAEDAELISLNKTAFEKLCAEYPQLANKIILNLVKVFSKRTREASEEYREMLLWTMQTPETA